MVHLRRDDSREHGYAAKRSSSASANSWRLLAVEEMEGISSHMDDDRESRAGIGRPIGRRVLSGYTCKITQARPCEMWSQRVEPNTAAR